MTKITKGIKPLFSVKDYLLKINSKDIGTNDHSLLFECYYFQQLSFYQFLRRKISFRQF